MKLRDTAFVLLLFLILPAACYALDELEPGTRLRVVTTGMAVRGGDAIPSRGEVYMIGRLSRVRSGLLHLQTGVYDSVAVPLAEVRRLEISGGTKSDALKGATIGTLAGAGVGLLAGLALGALVESGTGDRPKLIAYGISLGALGGCFLGILVGSTSHSEGWHEVPKPTGDIE